MKVNLFGTINVVECVRSLAEERGGPQIYMYVSTDYVAMFNEYNQTHTATEEPFRLSPVSYVPDFALQIPPESIKLALADDGRPAPAASPPGGCCGLPSPTRSRGRIHTDGQNLTILSGNVAA